MADACKSEKAEQKKFYRFGIKEEHLRIIVDIVCECSFLLPCIREIGSVDYFMYYERC